MGVFIESLEDATVTDVMPVVRKETTKNKGTKGTIPFNDFTYSALYIIYSDNNMITSMLMNAAALDGDDDDDDYE